MAMASAEGMSRITNFLQVLHKKINHTATFHLDSFEKASDCKSDYLGRFEE